MSVNREWVLNRDGVACLVVYYRVLCLVVYLLYSKLSRSRRNALLGRCGAYSMTCGWTGVASEGGNATPISVRYIQKYCLGSQGNSLGIVGA